MAMFPLHLPGFPNEFDLEGDPAESSGSGPALVLSMEKHDNSPGIAQALLNTLRLLDAGLLGLICVEEFFKGDVRSEVEAKLIGTKNKWNSLEEYAEGLKADLGGDGGVLDALAKAGGQQSFAKYLLILRPNAPVICMEDEALKLEADKISETVGPMYADVNDIVARKKLLVAKRRELSVNVDAEREKFFLEFARAKHAELGNPQAVLLNGGGRHMLRIAETLTAEKIGYLLLKPIGYKDELA
ncbi:MAG: hypothetical protein K8T89_10935 [Planctomycetes bacterium]|nr:hypothetical protein [Planctomycetota bacterium]